MRVQFGFTLDQSVVIRKSSRNGFVRALTIDQQRKQSARVEYVDTEGRTVIEWFDEAALVAVDARQ